MTSASSGSPTATVSLRPFSDSGSTPLLRARAGWTFFSAAGSGSKGGAT